MTKIKKGEIVARISHGKDILFVVDRIIDESIVILKGLTLRIEADANLKDLVIVTKEEIKNQMKIIESKGKEILKKKFFNRSIITNGKILHLDGDKNYAVKSYNHYKEMGLNAIVKNISEREQPKYIMQLLSKYKPDIIVITGHDGMLKRISKNDSLENYRNSKYFVNSTRVARKVQPDLVIFAGACQSYFEEIMLAGANFASSPGRVLIDYIDPLVVAEKVAITDDDRFVSINQIAPVLREGRLGVGGIGSKGKRKKT